MSYTWNPWHGCYKKSEGCENCYVYFFDKIRGKRADSIYRVKSNFNYPINTDRNGNYKIPSGSTVRVCITSDFFLQEADEWRPLAWDMIKIRSDLMFVLLTKRPERIKATLPNGWNDGWNNVFLNVTTENQMRADERIPILLDLPFKYKGILLTPFIGPVSLKKYLKNSQIANVIAGGENYANARLLRYNWVKNVYQECVDANVNFNFYDIGCNFEKDGKIYKITDKSKRLVLAQRSKLQHHAKEILFNYPLDKQLEFMF